MSDRIGAPGTGILRRDLLEATGATGTAAVAGCTAPVPKSTGSNVAAAGYEA